MSAPLCVAGKGLGWECDRAQGKAKHLCPAHYKQQRRDPTRPLAPLRVQDGTIMATTVMVGFQAWEADALWATTYASAQGLPASELYRKALNIGLAQIKLTGL